jgi:hypothetical protein
MIGEALSPLNAADLENSSAVSTRLISAVLLWKEPDMKDIAQQLRSIIETVEPQLSRMNDIDMSFKPALQEW